MRPFGTVEEWLPGATIDRYELTRCVGRGGMGSVWLARQNGAHGFSKRVALKVILPELAKNKQARTMFLDEARVVRTLSHPNVVQVLDLGEWHGMPYIAMEWVEGTSLDRLLSKELPLGLILGVAADICEGLHAAHELRDEAGKPLGLVHRDVSPQNILICRTGHAKLIDFGIAKAGGRLTPDTGDGVVKGKLAYMPPEQASSQTVDRRADIWALGAVLYRAVLGTEPLSRDADVLAFLSGKKVWRRLPNVPPSVADLVDRCLEPRSADRFATALDLRHAIDRVAQRADVWSATEIAEFIFPKAPATAPGRSELRVVPDRTLEDNPVSLAPTQSTMAGSSLKQRVSGPAILGLGTLVCMAGIGLGVRRAAHQRALESDRASEAVSASTQVNAIARTSESVPASQPSTPEIARPDRKPDRARSPVAPAAPVPRRNAAPGAPSQSTASPTAPARSGEPAFTLPTFR
jgi:serine/threonine-protein kinase